MEKLLFGRSKAILLSFVALLAFTNSATSGTIISDGSFETPALANDSFVINPTGSPWTFNQHSGIVNNSRFFVSGGVKAADGKQLAYIQAAHPSSSFGTILGRLSQTIVLADANTYRLDYFLGGRLGPSGEGGNLPFDIFLNGKLIGSDASKTAMKFEPRSLTFFSNAGSFNLVFQARRPVPDFNVFLDNMAFIDAVSVSAVPEPSSLTVIALSIAGTAGYRLRRRPTVAMS